MSEWMIKGSPEGFEGHPECKTDFYSDLKIIGPDSKEIGLSSKKITEGISIPQWVDIPKNSKFEWKVKTISDNEGKTDRANVVLKWFDSVYVAQITNDAMDELTDEQIQLAVDNPTAFTDLIMPLIENNLDPTLLLKTVYSDTFQTNDNGIYQGTIDILPQWPTGAYTLITHYGYSHEAEKSTSEKTMEVWIEEYIPLIIDGILIILGLIFTAGAASALIITAEFANLAYEMSFVAMDFYRTQMGRVGINKYDCSFPLSGFAHTYSITYETEDATDNMNNVFDSSNLALAKAIDDMLIARGLVYTVGMGALGIGIILIMMGRLKGGKGNG